MYYIIQDYLHTFKVYCKIQALLHHSNFIISYLPCSWTEVRDEIEFLSLSSRLIKIHFRAGRWWNMSLIPALGRQRQADICKFEASLGYRVCSRKTKTKTTTKNTFYDSHTKMKLPKSAFLRIYAFLQAIHNIFGILRNFSNGSSTQKEFISEKKKRI